MKKIIVNSIKCNHCGDILYSEFDTDERTCSCGTVTIKGGLEKLIRLFKNNVNDFEELSIEEEINEEGEEENETL